MMIRHRATVVFSDVESNACNETELGGKREGESMLQIEEGDIRRPLALRERNW